MDKMNVLVVDDDPTIRQLLSRFMGMNGYNVTEAEEGQSAYAMLKTGAFDVCLLDIEIPHMSGLEILEKLGRDAEFITPIIIITGQSDIGTIVNIMRLGAEDYLAKPFSLAEVKISVDRAVRLYAVKKENLRYRYYLEEEVARKTEDIRRSYLDIVRAFAGSVESRDPYTGGHTKRVSEIAVLLSAGLGLDEAKQAEVRIGGILHDIGKIGIADGILRKPGKLSEEEFREIRKHPLIGRDIIRDINSMKPMEPYIFCHHERFDGRGYPQGLGGERIPLEGRILAVADALDAMLSHRIYRTRMSLEDARREIVAHSGSQFDPAVVAVFEEIWRREAFLQIIGN
jgi:response regulator RpfG family c-di-GMP phosphodiesterase